jgi:PKD repeat protein
MAVKDVFSVELQTESGFEDITSGILNVDIVHGTEVYEGPYQQIDTGQFTIVSRNPNIDPKINSNLKFGSFIQFLDSRNVEAGKTNVFFGGWVTDIDVQYQRNDDPIITITGTDIFGLYQQSVVTQDIEDQGRSWASGITTGIDQNGISLNYLVNMNSWTLVEPGSIEYLGNATPGGIEPATPTDDYANYAPARYLPQVGETLLEVLNKYTQTNLNYCSIDHRVDSSHIKVYPFAKYNTFYWPPMQDPAIEFQTYNFSSDPADGRPYESILLNNGYRRVTNSITVSNETKTLEDPMDAFNTPINSSTTNFGPYVNTESNTQYGTATLDLNTIIPTAINDEERYATDIFQIVAFPSDEIQQITFDNARYEDIQDDYTYSFSQLNQFIRIKHQLNETETIDRFYDIAGIRHSINPDKWEMTFTFKPSQQEIAFTYQGQIPTIQMNALTGDTNFNFTATITDFPTETIDKVVWCLNGTNSNISEQWYYSQSETVIQEPNRYKNGLERNGLTQTWNFDDDGILAGPDFPTGGYGPGEWYVIAYIILNNGWVIAPYVKLTVGTPAVDADFLWSQNLTNNFGEVTFTDDSHNNEIGEPDSYLWNFGDGTTSTLKNPVHVYDPSPSTTTYSVSLTVFAYGPGGTKVYNTRTKTVTLAQPTMTPNFTWTQNQQTITFTNTSTNVGFEEPDAYFWEFGDGTTSTAKNPVKTYGVSENVSTPFSVKLTTRNIWEQTADVTKTVTVQAINASGTFGVRYIKFRIDSQTRSGTVPAGGDLFALTPVMSNLKALTSGTGANLSYLKPLIGFNDNSIPRMRWFATNGAAVQSSKGWQYFLTRSTQTDQSTYGDGPANQNSSSYAGLPYPTVRWELVVDLGEEINLINDITLRFEDLLVASGVYAGIYQESFYPKISVDVANVITDYTPNPAGTYGPATLNGNWVNIGYFKLTGGPMDPSVPQWPVQTRTSATKTMTKIRPMPLNIPYFNYKFFTGANDKQAQFSSVETADSYAWNFGDGTTSTDKNPLKTYAAYGTYNVTLAVTNGGVVTRTTTEPVIVQATIL